MTTEEKRLILLKRICAGRSQKELAKSTGLNQSYLSQLLNGHKTIGEKAAKNLEAKLGLRPGILLHPNGGNSLEGTPVASFFLSNSKNASSDPESISEDEPAPEINEQRVSILRALVGTSSRAGFCSAYSLNPSYLTNLFNGVRNIGEKSARNMEQILGLRPGVLEHPEGIEIDTPEKIQSLFINPRPTLSPKGRLLLKNLEAMLDLDVLTDDHIDLLAMMASQLALPRVEALSERSNPDE